MGDEVWAPITGFPDYEVSDHGRVRSDKALMALSRNQKGIRIVGLTVDHVQYKRSVAVLVARAFVDHNAHPAFNTPIHLNGNRDDCRAENLRWRPRWFARRYHQQFQSMPPDSGPIRETHTGETYEDIRHAAQSLGLLEKDIVLAMSLNTYVWPTFQVFQEVDTHL